MKPNIMRCPIFRITILITIIGFALLCPAVADDQNSNLPGNSYDVSDLRNVDDEAVAISANDLISSCFVLFYSSVTHTISNSIHINRLATSYLGSVDDNEVMLDLDELINIALNNNRMIEVVRQRQVQNKGQITQARSGYLPQLGLEGRYYYTEKQDSTPTDTDTEQLVSETEEIEEGEVTQGSASFSQLLYDFGRTSGAVKVGKSNLKATDAQLERQVQDIIFRARVAYYNVLEKRRLIDVAGESVKSFKQHLDQARLYLKAGVRTKIDVINAEVELSNAKMSLLRANYDLKTARVALEQILGTKPNHGKYTLYSDEVQLDNILETMPPVPDTLDNLINEAIAQRPDVVQINRLIEAAKANLKRLKADYWPSISADARYEDYDTELTLFKDSWEVGVSCNWDLFSGLRTKGAVVEAKGLLLENMAQLEDLQLAIVKEVTESYLRTDENRESVQIALQTLELAKENVMLAEKRYQSGANDVIEFNDAQLSLTRTRSELVVTYYGYLSALAGIEFAVGKLADESLLAKKERMSLYQQLLHPFTPSHNKPKNSGI